MRKNMGRNITKNFGGLTVVHRGNRRENERKENIMITPVLGEISGSIHVGLAGLGSAIGVGLVGMKASEAVGRNPGASTKILTIALIGMALAEAIVFYALFLVH